MFGADRHRYFCMMLYHSKEFGITLFNHKLFINCPFQNNLWDYFEIDQPASSSIPELQVKMNKYYNCTIILIASGFSK